MEHSPKKTIVYVGGFELPDKNAAAHRVINNGKIFRKLGYSVVFLGINRSNNKIVCENFFGFKCWSIPYPNSTKEWIHYLSDFSVLKDLIEYENPEGIIFYNYQAVSFLKALMYCCKRKIWTISDVTEWYLAEGNIVYRAIKQLDTSFRMRVLNKKADGIIAISSFLENYYNRTSDVETVRVPPLIDRADDKWKLLTERIESNKIQLIYAGSTSDLKDSLSLVYDATKLYKEYFVLKIVGMDMESVKRLLGVEGIDLGWVQVYGRLPHNECLKLIKQSDFQIFVRPDNLVTRAGFPTKLGESFACGTPVITNYSSNISDYLVDGENGFLVKEASKTSLSRVLSKVKTIDRETIDRMKIKCSEIDDFDYNRYIVMFTEFLKTLRGKEELAHADKKISHH